MRTSKTIAVWGLGCCVTRVTPKLMKTPRKMYFEKTDDVPNSTLPVLLFRGVLDAKTAGKARRFRKIFRENGWTGLWTDSIYDYTHFHSNAHEVLGIAEGRITVKLGGVDGRLFRLEAGDMLVIPSGVGHQRIGDDDGIKVIGAYPPGQAHFNMKRRGRVIPRVPLPPSDPFYGQAGPLMKCWSRVARQVI